MDNDLKKIRTDSGLTQAAFAEILGVSVRTVQDWEQGRRTPDRRSKIAIEKFLKDGKTV